MLLRPISFAIDNIRLTSGLEKYIAGTPSLGFNTIIADILWIKAIQYLGGLAKITEADAAIIYEMFDRITDLDPQFIEAYKLGGLALGVEDSEKAISLLEKGILNNKDIEWTVPYYASISAFFHLKNYKEAIKFLEIAVKSPEHPPHIDRLLAMANNLAGYKEVALDLWKDIYYKKATQSYEKDLAFKNLVKLSEEIVADASSDGMLKDKAKTILNDLNITN
jgi:tetratricopeptide (TPR) repeat protein